MVDLFPAMNKRAKSMAMLKFYVKEIENASLKPFFKTKTAQIYASYNEILPSMQIRSDGKNN